MAYPLDRFDTERVYEVPDLNKRRSSAADIDVNLLLRSQVGGSCYLFVAVLMIHTSYLRYILEKKFRKLEYLANYAPYSMTPSNHAQLNCLMWVFDITTNSEVCDTTLPPDIITAYDRVVNRTNTLRNEGNKWKPFKVVTLDRGGDSDHMLFTILNTCGVTVPEKNFVALLLKDIPRVFNPNHVYTVRKGTHTYLSMTMPEIMNATTYNPYEYGNTVLSDPFIATFYTSDKPTGVPDQGMVVADITIAKRLLSLLNSILFYIELFKGKYSSSELTRTHFSMSVIEINYGPDGKILRGDVAHAVLVDIDESNHIFVFDGNEGMSYPLNVWYDSFADKYIEIHDISVTIIPKMY